MKSFSVFHLPRSLAMALTGFFMVGILYTSTKPTLKVEGLNQSLIDRIFDLAHIPVYSVLTYLLLLVFCSFDFRRQAVAFAIAVLFGIFNEIVQIGTPGRSCSAHDMIDNALGAFITIVCLNVFFRKSTKTLV